MKVMPILARLALLAGFAITTLGGASAQQQSTLDTVISGKKLRVGIILSIPPVGFKDAQGNPDGYDVDVAKLAAEKLGAELEIVDTTAADRIPNLRTNKVDMIIGSFTMNAERAKVVSFSAPYITAIQMAIAVPKGSPVKGVGDLEGKTVAVVKGTTGAALFSTIAKGATVQTYDGAPQMLLALRQNLVDAIVDDGNLLNYQAKLSGDMEVIVDDAVKDYIDYNGIGVRRGDQEWLNWVNQFVFEMNATGKSKEIYRKWFGADMPPIFARF
ncbi:transporter substrate-binding domain-containing protein (plasmid) [Agrobacterium leguminum]|uniref:GlnH n=1 Tax=Agrobacterium deltaense NCPPB 1641 TaxID=1183425 RepID=A0A1S7U9E7_9HYPH|nr:MULTISPECIES: transporter substrate-binding domain-containing protein [Agrobacterium]WFS70095.1 transporter substrate-binding domain-containing protein [Agrobacterium leguminum]CVI63493.1 GlnH [Agrobacterium deltaense NCPPB 1641]